MQTLDATLTTVLTPWAQRLRAQLNLPVLVRWGDAPGLPLGEFAQPRVEIILRHPAAAPALLSPSLDRLGEAYVEGRMDLTGTAQDIVAIAERLAAHGDEGAAVAEGPVARLLHRLAEVTHHTREADRQSIQYHYDVSNAFYAAWLDPAMVYSCAYFAQGDETLAQAQQQKIDHILTKLRLQPGQTLLDIGCGWGALVIRAASRFGARCVGVTLSQNQFDLARERVREAGLQDQVEIRLQDYRDVHGPFDRITSVGMFEHVGLRHLKDYFHRIHELLAPQGWALNHGITSADAHNRETSYGGGRFIDRYVFPNGELPHIGTVLTAMQEGGLEVVDVEGLRRHYARTLQLWSEAFEAKTELLRSLVDEKHWRIWRVYLVGCQLAFERDEISLFQVLCRRAGGPVQEQPWSRGWMYGQGQAAVPPGLAGMAR